MPAIRPRRRGVGASIKPRHYNRGVGRPAMPVASFEEQPAEYSQTEYDSEGYGAMGLDQGDGAFGRNVIPANSQVNITVKPRRPIQIEEWRFPSTVIGLLIDDIAIGGTPVFANPGMPIELMSEASQLVQAHDQPTVTPSTGVTFTVRNPTGADLIFEGAGFGQVLRRG